MFETIKPYIGFPRDDPYAQRASVFKVVPTLVTLVVVLFTYFLVIAMFKSEIEESEEFEIQLEEN